MTSIGPVQLVAVTTHARHVASSERARFAADARGWPAEHTALLLETCHRVEAYAIARGGPVIDPPPVPPGGRILRDIAVVQHAISVAVGADSVVVGEDQILHQFRDALSAARETGHLDPVLERLFTVALRAGRQARSWRQGPVHSLADVAIGAIERQTGSLRGRGLLVVGAGQMGALAVRAGREAGAVVSVTSRTLERAQDLAARTGVRAVAFDPSLEAADLAGVVVALRGRWATSAATEEALLAGLAVVVDLSVPSAVPEGLATELGERFVSADAIAVSEAGGAGSPNARLERRLDALVASATVGFSSWLEAHDRRTAAEALALQVEGARAAEIAVLWRRLPDIDLETREVIEGMSRHLAERLLREPLANLSRDADGRHERAIRELFGL